MGIEDERAVIKVCSSRGSSLDFGQFHQDVGLSILRAELGIDPDNQIQDRGEHDDVDVRDGSSPAKSIEPLGFTDEKAAVYNSRIRFNILY